MNTCFARPATLPDFMNKTSLLRLTQPLLGLLLFAGTTAPILKVQAAEPKKILVVTTTAGFRHSSIETAEKVLAKLSHQTGLFTLDYAQQPPNHPNPPRKPAKDAAAEELAKFQAEETKYKAAQDQWDMELKHSLSKLSPENLKHYDAVIFANTTGDLPLPDRQGFVDWVAEGHAFVGMHAASDTYDTYNDPKRGFAPYIQMLGGEFAGHGSQVGIECLVQDTKHPATKHLGESFCIEQEEVYLIKNYDASKVHELLVLDKHPNKKKESGHFPVAWCKDFGQGKVFYTTLGHREDVWENERYQKHILGGIKWALGLEPGDAKPQASAKDLKTQHRPAQQVSN
jgi:type 1 glutamine amidotransferase